MFQVIIALLGTLFVYYLSRKRGKSNLPPGPRGLPIVGNIMHLPPKGMPEYQHWLKFKDIYGSISSVTVLGTTLIIIHDRKAAHDILEKNSLKTSGRPKFYFGSDLCGYGKLLSFLQYNDTFRHHRKLVHQQLGTKTAIARFRDIQDVESRRFLLRVLDDPLKLTQHIKTPRSADPLVLLIERMMNEFSLAFRPLTWAVDVIPILKYLPEGLPGTSFQKTARKWNKVTRMVIETPYAFVRQQMTKGVHRPSYVASLVTHHENDSRGNINWKYEENAIKRTAAIMFAGGADTTVTSITGFILAMLLFPAIQKKAKDEIDLIIGVSRLPQLEDRDKLPYVSALVKETLRWLPVAPSGATHTTDEAFDYNGYYIPKGANLMPAVWWFLHDPQTYSDPSAFDPDRYLEPRNEPDPASEAFGYGRRICPGRYLADESLFLTISRLLAVFDINKAVDKRGEEIVPEINITPGLIGHPREFPYIIKPRSAKHVDLIRSIEVDHPWEEGDAGLLSPSLGLDEE
ncbi:Cytochrome P450 CYP620C3 [Metarhizium robertsii ARSEF 23]|uniref:Cytochrome P450 CYP620C3 n=1 Tax=Metarhizium robertsii (strain ARSEF 23 / ATCC MYA-3075) TaxID=655844 RepID=E9END0_METRA|nr:Cytochrome P450 CYP620C3 [Metarhizium robertsii ARSEF 23]EFZ04142.2 Cytochrome P450 CYP620C3 [Metarhizium robertsii ARSEF 23]